MTTTVLTCALLAVATATVALLARLRAPLGADEGYLWFGVQQLLRGRLPHRDFKSYEPGRYAWCGAFAWVLGRDLVVVRIATHAFFACALGVALVVLQGLGVGWLGLVAAAIALAALAHPQHKQFEHGGILLAWACNAQLLAQPSPTHVAIAAAAVGLTLFFGFNWFLYFGAALATTLVLAFVLHDLAFLDTLGVAVAAGTVGLVPFLLFLLSPRFARQFWQRRFATVFARGQSNLAQPLPWPWRAVPPQLRNLAQAHVHAFRWSFLALFAVPVIAGPVAWFAPDLFDGMAPALLAAAALGPFVAHHAASRADPPHITQAAGPLALVLLLVAASFPPAMFVVAAGALWLTWPLQPFVQRRRHPDYFCRVPAGRIEIDCPRFQARLLEVASSLSEGASRDALFVAPAYAAIYAQLGRDAPVYDTFALYQADATSQREAIAALERVPVRAAVVSNAPTDGREELRFSQTHPDLWAFLHARFEATHRADLGEDVFVFTRA